MAAGRHQLWHLLFSVLAWIAAIGLYLLVRFHGTEDVADWATKPGALELLTLAVGTIFGLLYFLIGLISESKVLRRRSYGFIIAFKAIGLFLTACLIVFVSRFAAYLQDTLALEDVWPSFVARLGHDAVQSFFIYATVVAIVLSLLRQMWIMTGGRVLVNLLLGKYHSPQQEERIFMFLDMKDSTTHAERLGHLHYCRLVQDCFYDLTDSALAHQVEIYQYAGDEAILTWRMHDGLRNANCLTVFGQFERTLQDKAALYRERYGIVPQFKAGVNLGPVTAAEVGVLKRDIAYFSDVLNTAARIQSKCNEYGKRLLISGAVRRALASVPDLPAMERLGDIPLKGKELPVEVYAVAF